MDSNNLASSPAVREQWLINIYLQEFVGLKMYAVRIVRNEIEAENIVAQGFNKLVRELSDNPGKFSSPAKAKAYLVTIIRHKCISWLRKKRLVAVCEPAEAMEAIMDDHHFLRAFEKNNQLQHLLSLIDQLPPQLQQVATLFLKEGLTSEEVEKNMNLNKEVLRVYKNRVVNKLREMVHKEKSTVSLNQMIASL